MKLDQFYTTPQVAKECFGVLRKHLLKAGVADSTYFVEPSAGDGVFLGLLPEDRRIGIDFSPAHKEILKADFLSWTPKTGDRKNRVVIGNPPFGKRGVLAKDFICHASDIADTVAFILPMCFRKYALQNKLPADLRLIEQYDLKRGSFRLPSGKPHGVKTEFQIWTRTLAGVKDMRRTKPEPITHDDFIMRQYNNTREALKMFDLPFDFAVPCQGWQDYTRREKTADKCEINKQWMLFRSRSREAIKKRKVIEKLDGIDFGDLAYRVATSVPGFRKRDVVEAYNHA